MPVTDNRDNGSLFTGSKVELGQHIQIKGETRVRRVTYVMGSDRNGWHACFKGQGAVPTGSVSWTPVESADDVLADNPMTISSSSALHSARSQRIASTRSWPVLPLWLATPPTAVFYGFDSAWTRHNCGAIAAIALVAGHSQLIGPQTADFNDALLFVNDPSHHAPLQLIAIDQPLVVPNPGGSRPVEGVVRPAMSRLNGAIQPANRGRTDMFGDDAPIWPFLEALSADLDPIHSPRAPEGRFAIEVYPALATAGLFQAFFDRRRQAKYNPTRKTFAIDDWRLLCLLLASLCDEERIEGGSAWCGFAAEIENPTKNDQDRLDAVICSLCAFLWWNHGLERSVIIGDSLTGYIVAPAHPSLAAQLASSASERGVLFRTRIGQPVATYAP